MELTQIAALLQKVVEEGRYASSEEREALCQTVEVMEHLVNEKGYKTAAELGALV